jgi:curved DNA-binding protein CbpA
MDPYIVLGLDKNYTLDQLRRAYRKQVLRYHPDKSANIEATPVFQSLTFCYQYLLKELKLKQEDKDHDTLKKESKSGLENQTPTMNVDMMVDPSKAKNMDINKFNKAFDKVKKMGMKGRGCEDDGYADWLKSEKDIDGNGAIIHYEEPEAIHGGKLNFTILGQENVDDYSQIAPGRGGPAFMDIKKALTTTKIVDESVCSRDEFKTVEDLKKHRSTIEFTMNKQELNQYMKKQQVEKDKELARQQNVKKQDTYIEKLFNQANKLMIDTIFKK